MAKKFYTRLAQMSAEERVKNGVRWLNENFPGWLKHINQRNLDLSDGSECICGQVFRKPSEEVAFYNGFEYARYTLFSEANSWINALVSRPTTRGRKEYGDFLSQKAQERARRVSLALGFDAGYKVGFEDLQKEWKHVIKELKSK